MRSQNIPDTNTISVIYCNIKCELKKIRYLHPLKKISTAHNMEKNYEVDPASKHAFVQKAKFF